MGNLVLVFHFSMAVKLGCGNVEISRRLRDFQGTVERVGKLLWLFHSFHGPAISTALAPGLRPAIIEMRTPISHMAGGTGDSILHCRRSWVLAVVILRAHSVSLIFRAICSNCAKLTLGFKYVSSFSNPCNFSYGVA